MKQQPTTAVPLTVAAPPLRWWRVKDVARMLKCDKQTVWAMIRCGRLRAAKLGRSYRISDTALRNLERS